MKKIVNIDLYHILYGIIYVLSYKIYFFNLMINNTLNLLMISQNYMLYKENDIKFILEEVVR